MKAKAIHVAATVIYKDGLYLLAQRPAHKPQGSLWEVSRRKMERGETPRQALARDLFEKLAPRDITVGAMLEASKYDYGSL